MFMHFFNLDLLRFVPTVRIIWHALHALCCNKPPPLACNYHCFNNQRESCIIDVIPTMFSINDIT